MAGDIVLRLASRRMRSIIRAYDYIGRYGGEEFLIVLPGCDEQQALHFAERLRQSIGEESIDIPEGRIPVTMSLGVATLCKDKICDAGSLVQAADQALYRAKKNGRNRVETATEQEENYGYPLI
jgi:diguanylate cyclase (GGDEF)-like protein